MSAGNQSHLNRKAIRLVVITTLLVVSLLPASRLSASSVNAPAFLTWVGGPIISDTTWTLAGSPYIVTANVQVTTGVTLTIEAGVVVRFNTGTLLQVDGVLIARGTTDNPITFTSNQANPARGNWKNIAFTDGSVDATFDDAGNYTGGSILEYCVVEYGGNGLVLGAIQIDQASPLIDHCTVRHNLTYGVSSIGIGSSPVAIRHNTISGAIAVQNSILTDNIVSWIYAYRSTVTDNIISGNSGSGVNYGGGIYAVRSTLTGNIVSGNSAAPIGGDACGGGIYAESSTVTGNIVSGNFVGSALSGVGLGGGIYAKDSTVTDNTVSDNSALGSGGGIYAENSIVMSNIVSHNWAGGYAYGGGGGIYAVNSRVAENTISRNSAGDYSEGGGIYASNSPVTGNIVIGNSAYDGGGIYADSSMVLSNAVSDNSASYGGGIYASSSPVLSNTITANSLSSADHWGWASAVYLNSSADFLYNTIVGNTIVSPTAMNGGIYVGDPLQFHHNNVYGNTNYDVSVQSSGDISGTYNYWGTVITADIEAHILDRHNHLLYVPYLQDPDPNAPVPPPLNLQASFGGGSTRLSWDAIPSTTAIYGYKVYYDTDASGPPYQGAGAAEGDSPIDVGSATHFTLSGLGDGGVHIAVTAYDAQGRESWYSNEAVSLWRVYLPSVTGSSQ